MSTAPAEAPAWAPGRLALRNALADVEGLDALAVAPDLATHGAAWPVWVRRRFGGGKLRRPWADTYDVLVTLPGAYAPHDAEQSDAWLEAVTRALHDVAELEEAAPRLIRFGPDATLPGFMIRCTPHVC